VYFWPKEGQHDGGGRLRTKVFISYSHKDRRWLERLQTHMRTLTREGTVEVWDDSLISPGSNWRAEIQQALATTKVAVLLISADFLASDFVATDEVPELLKAAEEDGATILSLILSPSRFMQTQLAKFQGLNSPDKPLIRLVKWRQEEILVETTEEVMKALAANSKKSLEPVVALERKKAEAPVEKGKSRETDSEVFRPFENMRRFGQPDPRSDAERLVDLRNIQRQVLTIRTARDDLAEVTHLLMRAEAQPSVRVLLDAYDFEPDPVVELDHRVVRLRNRRRDPSEVASIAAKLRQQSVPISANYGLTAMIGYVKQGVAGPKQTAGLAPVWPKGAGTYDKEHEQNEKSPIRIVIIDTGVFGVRSDGWLSALQTQENLEDLDDSPRDGFLDLAAGQGSFCAGIVQQIVPEAHIVASKALYSDGLVDELRIARALVHEVRAGLEAGQHVIVNLSVGTETADDEQPVALGVALEIIDEESRQAGLETVVVAAAGNFGHDRPCFPAAFSTVTAVAAVTQQMLPAQWSSRGVWVDVSTIGEGVRSTFVPGLVSPDVDLDFVQFPEDAWALWSGTSFAAAQVTGAIAKIAIDDGVAPTEGRRRLLAGAVALPLYGKRVEILPRI
jgi:Subtilase family/TIR domain